MIQIEFDFIWEEAYLRILVQLYIGPRCIHEAPQARSAEGAQRRRRAVPKARSAEGAGAKRRRRRREAPKAREVSKQLKFRHPCHIMVRGVRLCGNRQRGKGFWASGGRHSPRRRGPSGEARCRPQFRRPRTWIRSTAKPRRRCR